MLWSEFKFKKLAKFFASAFSCYFKKKRLNEVKRYDITYEDLRKWKYGMKFTLYQ